MKATWNLQSANAAEWIHSQTSRSNGKEILRPQPIQTFNMPHLCWTSLLHAFLICPHFIFLPPLPSLLWANFLLFYILSYIFFSLTTALVLPPPSEQTLPPPPPSLAMVECWNSRRESEEGGLGSTAWSHMASQHFFSFSPCVCVCVCLLNQDQRATLILKNCCFKFWVVNTALCFLCCSFLFKCHFWVDTVTWDNLSSQLNQNCFLKKAYTTFLLGQTQFYVFLLWIINNKWITRCFTGLIYLMFSEICPSVEDV